LSDSKHVHLLLDLTDVVIGRSKLIGDDIVDSYYVGTAQLCHSTFSQAQSIFSKRAQKKV
jgi:hypothetical protein